MWCLRPVEPIVDHAEELQKHRHNVLTIMRNSNATPFRAYHVDDGFACCFCHKLYQKAADLKLHNISYHAADIDTFKKNCTSIFTYVVKLDVTGLRCNICHTEFKTLEELLPHFPTHDVILHTDIKNQITCFKFDSDDIRCLYCNQEYSNFKFLLEHMNEHYKNYLCADCGAGFINFRMLTAHADGHDLTVGEVKCPLCYEIFDTLSKLKHHESLAHAGFDLDTNKCVHCGLDFESDECLRSHVTEVHDGRHVYKCGACNKMYPIKKMLVAHTRRAHSLEDKNFKCDECGKGFYERQTLMHHMSKHTETKSYQCDLCSKMFKWKRTLRRHLETHALKGAHKCFECDEAFFRKSFLDDHMRQVHMHEERTKCPVCGKMFYHSQMKNHTARRHSEFRTYKCEICFTECKTKYLLIQHMGTHDDFKPQKKEYECLACGKKFDRKIYVLKHTQRVHLLEKRYVCDQCGRRFADTTTLKNHVALHSETNMFQCFGCPRTFKTKKTMMNHARNHMEERKVKCDICNHGFIYPYLLKEHMKQVHKILGN